MATKGSQESPWELQNDAPGPPWCHLGQVLKKWPASIPILDVFGDHFWDHVEPSETQKTQKTKKTRTMYRAYTSLRSRKCKTCNAKKHHGFPSEIDTFERS